MAANNSNVQLRKYNKTAMTQLGTCIVEVEHKNNKKKTRFFVVPSNRQALQGMPDINMPNILKINIHAIGTEQTRGNDNCCANMQAVQGNDQMQEMIKDEKCCTNKDGISKSNSRVKSMVKSKLSDTTEYFLSGPSYDSKKKRSAETMPQLQKEFEDVFNGIECFNSTFSLQLKPDSKPYQVPLRLVAYTLQNPFEEELERLHKQDIIRIDETSEWCNNFARVPKVNGKVRLCLDPAWLNEALIRSIHRRPSLMDILPKLNNAKYLSLIGVSSGYHNLKQEEKSSYFMIFTCQFRRYRYKRLPFGAALAGDMFQRKIDEIFKDMPNVFSIADDILVAGYEADGKDHDETTEGAAEM